MFRRVGSFSLPVVVAALLLATDGWAVEVDCGRLDVAIAGARTKADHEAIAACYDGMAKEAAAKAERHERMAGSYRKWGAAPATKLDLPAHCEHIAKGLRDEAASLQRMAGTHREMAKAAK